MQKKDTQKPMRRFYKTKIFLLIVFVLAIFVVSNYVRGYYQDYKIQQEIKLLQQEVQTLETKKIESLEILQYVMSDDYIEEKARTELDLKKPGERVIHIATDSTIAHQDTRGTGAGDDTPLNNPAKWWYYFFAHTQ